MTSSASRLSLLALMFTVMIAAHIALLPVARDRACCADTLTQWDAGGHFKLGQDVVFTATFAVALVIAVWWRRGIRAAALIMLEVTLAFLVVGLVLMVSARPQTYQWTPTEWYIRNVVSGWLIVMMTLGLSAAIFRRLHLRPGRGSKRWGQSERRKSTVHPDLNVPPMEK